MSVSRFFITTGLILATFTVAAAESIVVYSGRSDKFVKPAVEQFKAQTGIEVVLHSGKSTALLNKLQVEGARSSADLFISNDAGTLQKGTEIGLWETLPGSLTEEIPANYQSKDKSWIGLSARARVLVVNTKLLKPGQVASVFDLAEPRFKGKLAITNSTNESYIAGATVYMQAAGAERTQGWLEGLKANVGTQVYNKHGKIVADVASGRKQLGLVNHYYIYRHLAKHPDAPITMVVPDQSDKGMGVAWNVSGVALSKHSKHKPAALRFIEFLVSKEGQQIFAEVNREYPTREGVPASAEVPPLQSFKVADVPMYELGDKRNPTIDLIERVGMP